MRIEESNLRGSPSPDLESSTKKSKGILKNSNNT